MLKLTRLLASLMDAGLTSTARSECQFHVISRIYAYRYVHCILTSPSMMGLYQHYLGLIAYSAVARYR